MPSVVYWDLVARYDAQGVSFTGGVTNLLDRAPPFFPDGETNSSPNTYDYLGRSFFVRASYRL